MRLADESQTQVTDSVGSNEDWEDLDESIIR